MVPRILSFHFWSTARWETTYHGLKFLWSEWCKKPAVPCTEKNLIKKGRCGERDPSQNDPTEKLKKPISKAKRFPPERGRDGTRFPCTARPFCGKLLVSTEVDFLLTNFVLQEHQPGVGWHSGWLVFRPLCWVQPTYRSRSHFVFPVNLTFQSRGAQ